MKKIAIKILGIAILLISGCVTPSYAQLGNIFSPKGGRAIEISLENSLYNRLPIYQNSITSLIAIGNNVVGGTSAKQGLSPYIFTASLKRHKLTHKQILKSVVPDQQSIRSGFCKDGNLLYAGTLPDTSRTGSGHLFKVKITTSGNIKITDLGKPIPGEGIFTLTCNANKTMLYGISYPSGFFFTYNIRSGNTKIYKSIAPSEKVKHIYHEYGIDSPRKYLSRELIVDDQGRVFGSKPINKLFYFDPRSNQLHVLKDEIPTVWAHRVVGRVDSWVKLNGFLYGGNAGDGLLFRINPSTLEVKNLGKPIMMNRIVGLAAGSDGKIYGVAGGPRGYAHVFSYDPAENSKGFVDYGPPTFKMVSSGVLKHGIQWQGFNFATVISAENGNYIVMGENEALSQLLAFPVANAKRQIYKLK